jgi:hypothetical protein
MKQLSLRAACANLSTPHSFAACPFALALFLAASAILAADTAAAAADDTGATVPAGDNFAAGNISIAFWGLSYFVSDPQAASSGSSGGKKPKGGTELQLLDGVTGSFRPGVLTALMVSSW